jgi:predicted dehydrogenase
VSDVFSGPAESVVIATRHHLHAPLTLLGLAADKHLFVEKPLCLTRDELAQIDSAMLQSQGSLMIGFNRRFAPATIEIKKLISSAPGPKSLAFQIFAGPLSPDHWYANLEQSGGRIVGEACHFFDYACHLLGTPIQVTAQTIGRHASTDSVTAQIEFLDGSSAQIIYSAEGDASFPKESFRLFGSGFVAECENFQRLTIHKSRRQRVMKFSSKGHAEEMAAWLSFLKGKSSHPLAYPEAQQSMRLTFAVMDSIREGRTIAA